MAFSDIGLRREGDTRARTEARLLQEITVAGDLRAEVWRSFAAGSTSTRLGGADLDAVRHWTSPEPAASAFAATIATVRAALDRGDVAGARAAAAAADTDLKRL